MNIINAYRLEAYDPVTTAWLAELIASFSAQPSGSYCTALDTMIRGMRSDGDLLELDRFWIFAQSNQNFARVSIVNPTSTKITEVNSPTWTSLQGYTGNGTTMYLNSNFNYLNNSVKTKRDSISHGIYVTSNVAENKFDAGYYTAARDITIAARWGDGRAYIAANNSSGEANGIVANSLGMFSGRRTSTAAGSTAYKNGSSIGTQVDADNSLPLVTDTIIGTNSSIGSKRLAMRFIGSGLINHLNFYNRFQTFATAIGFNV